MHQFQFPCVTCLLQLSWFMLGYTILQMKCNGLTTCCQITFIYPFNIVLALSEKSNISMSIRTNKNQLASLDDLSHTVYTDVTLFVYGIIPFLFVLINSHQCEFLSFSSL